MCACGHGQKESFAFSSIFDFVEWPLEPVGCDGFQLERREV